MTETAGSAELTIVTGMSGAGRSTAADVLEDLGYFVVDNLPPALIAQFVDHAASQEDARRQALVVNVRGGQIVEDLLAALDELSGRGVEIRILFVDASDDALVRRYEASRRPHPLSEGGRVSEGITAERERLAALKGAADVVVDTSDLNVHQLRARLEELLGGEQAGLQLNIVSFGFKHGLPLDVDIVFDCRFLPNPYWNDELRPLTGRDEPVRDHVLGQSEAQALLDQLETLFALLLPAYEREGKSYLSIGVGCTGGRHRSVVIAEALATRFGAMSVPVQHRDIDRE